MKQVKARSKSCKRLPKLLCGFSIEVQKLILQKLTTLEALLKNWESMPSAKDDRPLNFKEACTYIGYAPSYLYKLTYQNIIPHYKPTGKMIFFSKNEVDQWIFRSSHKAQGTSDEVTECQSARVEKDPNQMEIFNKTKDHAEEALGNSKEASSTALGMTKETDASPINSLRLGQGSAQELLIEFPLKRRRTKK